MPINTPPIQQALTVTPAGAAGGGSAVWTKAWANWMSQAWAILAAVEQSGVTANRPTTNLWVGRTYFDTTLGLPLWYDGNVVTGWIDAAGNQV